MDATQVEKKEPVGICYLKTSVLTGIVGPIAIKK
jgi:hypothetical protein